MSLRRWRVVRVRGVRRLATWPRTFLVQAYQPLWLVLCDGVYRHFTLRSPCPGSWFPTALRLAVVVSAHAFTTLSAGEEVTLFLELPTSRLLKTPVQVGDCWQNSR